MEEQKEEVKNQIESMANYMAMALSETDETKTIFNNRKEAMIYMLTQLCKMYQIAYR